MRSVLISDTHSHHREINLPSGDVLIFAGDVTFGGELDIIDDFSNWLKELPHKHKICIFGNHEIGIEAGYKRSIAIDMINKSGAVYLEDSGIEISGKKFWGSPITPWFHNWEWNRQRGEEIAVHWDKIPLDTNVLITHGPPAGIRDQTKHGMAVGCEELLKKVKQLPNLKLHVFGHIHEGYGITAQDGTVFVNACTCTLRYAPTNQPIVVDL